MSLSVCLFYYTNEVFGLGGKAAVVLAGEAPSRPEQTKPKQKLEIEDGMEEMDERREVGGRLSARPVPKAYVYGV